MDIITVGRKNVGKELGGGAVWCDCPSDANRGRSGFYCKGVPLVNGQNCCERNVQKICYIGKKTQMGGPGIDKYENEFGRVNPFDQYGSGPRRTMGFEGSGMIDPNYSADAVTDIVYEQWNLADGTTGGATPPPPSNPPAQPTPAPTGGRRFNSYNRLKDNYGCG